MLLLGRRRPLGVVAVVVALFAVLGVGFALAVATLMGITVAVIQGLLS